MSTSLPDDLYNDILTKSQQLFKQQVQWRRHLHQHPELSNQEFKTTRYIKDYLKKISVPVKKLSMPTGVLAEIKGSGPGNTAAMRTDIDALPILEQSGVPFSSKNSGCMHACGHDVHMAVVLGATTILKQIRHQFPGSVRVLFQPAEEMPPGGARPMIENGAMDDVSMIFGLHVDPNLPVGKISVRDGVTMASVTDFELIIEGVGGHAARPQDAVDPIVCASEIVMSVQKIVSREMDPIDPVAITFGKIEGGTASNIICDKVVLSGTARSLSAKNARLLPQRIKRTASHIAKAHGAKVTMDIIANYPVLANHPATNKIISRACEKLYGKHKVEVTPQVLGGEDFACYLEKAKGAMFRLGIRNKKISAVHSWHSPKFKVDEHAIQYGTAILAASVIDFLRTSR